MHWKTALGALVMSTVGFASGVLAAPFAYVANEKSGNISVIDIASDTVVATFPAGKRPRGMTSSKDGKVLYVSDQPANALQIVDVGTRKITGKVDSG